MVNWRWMFFSMLPLALAANNLAAMQAGRDVLLEVELIPPKVYVQAQAVYRMRFFQAVDVRDLKFSGPSARLAEVRPIGADTVSETQRDGRRYRVHERRFAVFPFSSGDLELTGAGVDGRIVSPDATSADGRKPIRMNAPAQTLKVLPVSPTLGATPWLPARALTMTESWTPADSQLRVGQALRRHVRIEAMGVDAAQIPPMELTAPGMRIHPESARLENSAVGDVNLGVRDQVFSMVALKDGEVVVPQVRLPWWNAQIDSLSTATLPSRTLHVKVGDATVAPTLITAPPPAPKAAQPQLARTITTSMPGLTPWLTAIVVFCGGALLAWVKRASWGAEWALWRACRNGQMSAVRDGLLQWAALRWPKSPPMTLEAFAGRLNDPAARDALASIDRCLYGPTQGACDATVMVATVRAIKRGSPSAFYRRT